MMATSRRRKRRQTVTKAGQGQNDAVQSKATVTTVKRSVRNRRVVVEDADTVAQWSSVGTSTGLSTDADVAKYLVSLFSSGRCEEKSLKRYFSHRQETVQDARCVHCKASLVLYCLACQLSPPQALPVTSPMPSQTLVSKITAVNTELPSSAQLLSQASITSPSVGNSAKEHEGNAFSPNSSVDSCCDSQSQFSVAVSDVECEETEDGAESPSGTEQRAPSGWGTVSPGGSRLRESSRQTTEIPQGTELQESSMYKAESPKGTEWQESSELGTLGSQSTEVQGHSALENLSPQRSELQEHSTVKDPDLYVCPYCSQILSSTHHKRHVSTHSDVVDKGAYCCSVCAKTFPHFNSFYNHIRLCLSDQKCCQCDQVFVSRCQLNKHWKQHEREKARYCGHCQRSLPNMSKKDFDRHLKKHEKKGNGRAAEAALCPECGKIFKKKDDLNTHMTYHNIDSPFPCSLCPKAFKNKACLRQHELFHGDKTQQCEICGAKFYRKAGLKRHMQKHSGKQYGCNKCARKFCSSTELQVHIEAVHKGIRRFPCGLCDLKFYKAASLKIHTRTHTGEKPYSCDQCPAEFSVGEALRKHKRRHTGEKPFCCEDCGQAYSCQSSYKMHRKKHHADSVYPCGDCQEVFVVRSSLDFHHKMCHGGRGNMHTEHSLPADGALHVDTENCQLSVSDNALHLNTENTLPSNCEVHMYSANSQPSDHTPHQQGLNLLQ